MLFKYKSLIFNVLYFLLIIRIFASEKESARKYSLIFWVDEETLAEKSKSAYNLKVDRIVSFHHAKTMLIRN